jgi:hypothetical protein
LRKRLSAGFVLFAGLLAAPAITHTEQHNTVAVSYQNDVRYERLKLFLQKRKSPIENLAGDFVAASDRHNLDWRLLPAIAVLESGAGQRYMNNNIFGWDSCQVSFPSVRSGIHYVASRLANSKLYKDKDLDGILRTYNPYESYPGRIKRIMRSLGPADSQFVTTLN